MVFRFMHIADIHLDTPFQNRDERLRQVLGECVRKSFSASVDLAIERKVHALLIAGDLFDDSSLSYRTVKFLQRELERLGEKGIEVFYSPGNHDPIMGNGYDKVINWPDNVHIFSSPEAESVPVLDENGRLLAYVVGAGHERRAEGRNLVKGFPQRMGSVPYVGLLHCLLLDGQGAGEHERYAPCTRWDLEEKGYAYWALGHIHRRMEYRDNTYIVYPGNICGRNFKETGVKGGYYVEVNDMGTLKVEFIPLSNNIWIDLEICGLEEIDSWPSFEAYLTSCVTEKLEEIPSYAGINMVFVRLKLTGASPMYRELLNWENIEAMEEDMASDLGLDSLEINTEHIYSPIKIDDYKGGPHLASYTLKLIEEAKGDEELLISLAPDPIARKAVRGSKVETLEYLKELLEGLENEALVHLIEEDGYEI
ncbi:MAG TPA: DNA repair exonuclease [Clostridiales bacterium]|nr:DNA repair exonuclease [Clostridiales bacterium]